jgi:hypothetical protein
MFESTIASATASLFGGAGRSLFFDDSGAAAEDNTSPTSTTNSNTGGDDTAVDGDSNPPNPVDGNDEATNGNTKAPEGVGGSNADDARVHELEQELDEIRRAFEEYVATTQGLESGMDDEMKHLSKFRTEHDSRGIHVCERGRERWRWRARMCRACVKSNHG